MKAETNCRTNKKNSWFFPLNRNKKRIPVAIALLIVTGFFVYSAYFKPSFKLEDIQPIDSYQSRWNLPSATIQEKLELQGILAQDFRYLDEGGQSYVFISADQRYVLKLFKFNRFRGSPWVALLPKAPPFQDHVEKHLSKRKQKFKAAFQGHFLGYSELKSRSGLIFLQLNASTELMPTIHLTDKTEKTYQIDLQTIPFVIQKSGTILSTHLATLLDVGNVELVRTRLDQLHALFLSEYAKNIYDLDRGILHNIGYNEGELFHLDIGKLSSHDQIHLPQYYRAELQILAFKIESWLKKYYPQYTVELTDYLTTSWNLI